MAVSVSVVYVFLLLLDLSLEENCTDQFKSDMTISPVCRRGVQECNPSAMRKTFPHLYNNSGWRTDVPSFVNATPFCKEDGNGGNQPGFLVQWRLPQHNGAANIQGFEIHLEGHFDDYRCFLVRLQENVTKLSQKSLFRGTIFPVARGMLFQVVLFSLPRTLDSQSVTTTVKSMKCDSKSSSGHWTPLVINVTYNYSERELTVSFDSPPRRFRFDQFKVTLINIANSTVMEEQIPQTYHTFKGIEPGEYHVYVEPYDPERFNKTLCKCKTIENDCTGCTLSERGYVAVADEPEIQSVKEDTVYSARPSKLIGISVACVVIAVLALAVLYVLKRRNKLKCCAVDTEDNVASKYQEPCYKLIICISTKSPTTNDNAMQTVNTVKEMLAVELGQRVKIVTAEYGGDLVDKLEKLVYEFTDNNVSDSDMGSLKVKLALQHTCHNKSDKLRTADDKAYMSEYVKLPIVETGKPLSIMLCFVLTNSLSEYNLTEINKYIDVKVKVNVVSQVTVQTAAVFDRKEFKTGRDILSCFDGKCFELKKEKNMFLSYVKDSIGVTEEENGSQTKYSTLINNKVDCMIPSIDNGVSLGILPPACSMDRNKSSTVHLTEQSNHAGGTFLEVPCSKRERYVSSDSGRGGSECSCKVNSFDDCFESFNEGEESTHSTDFENDCLLPKQCILSSPYSRSTCKYYLPTNLQTVSYAPYAQRCPSGVVFLPPEPSEISESDAAEIALAADVYGDAGVHWSCYDKVKNIERIPCSHGYLYKNVDAAAVTIENENADIPLGKMKTSKQKAESMESLMEKMVAINKRSESLIEHEAKMGEASSVC